jgi:hypothetical protein
MKTWQPLTASGCRLAEPSAASDNVRPVVACRSVAAPDSTELLNEGKRVGYWRLRVRVTPAATVVARTQPAAISR